MNNIELVEYAKKQYNSKNMYMYGTYGQKLTQPLLNYKIKQYPWYYTTARVNALKNNMGITVFDCVGLVKSFYWGGVGNLKYNSKTDVSANGMYNRAKVKGNINTIDRKKKGLLVHMDGHMGISAGDGTVYEATVSNNAYKIIRTKLDGRGWEHWLECPYIEYVKDEPVNNVNKSVDELAREVLDGKWGNGSDRRKRLTAAGYNYTEVQARVNQMLYGKKPQLKSTDEIAREVINGNWGNGEERKKRLTAAGYNYAVVQKRVNELLRS
jgi:hypothetical protein